MAEAQRVNSDAAKEGNQKGNPDTQLRELKSAAGSRTDLLGLDSGTVESEADARGVGDNMSEHPKGVRKFKTAKARQKAREEASKNKYRAALRDRNIQKMVKGGSLANTPTAAGRATMVVRLDFFRSSDDELTVKAGELVQIISSSATAGIDNDDLRQHDKEEELDPGFVGFFI